MNAREERLRRREEERRNRRIQTGKAITGSTTTLEQRNNDREMYRQQLEMKRQVIPPPVHNNNNNSVIDDAVARRREALEKRNQIWEEKKRQHAEKNMNTSPQVPAFHENQIWEEKKSMNTAPQVQAFDETKRNREEKKTIQEKVPPSAPRVLNPSEYARELQQQIEYKRIAKEEESRRERREIAFTETTPEPPVGKRNAAQQEYGRQLQQQMYEQKQQQNRGRYAQQPPSPTSLSNNPITPGKGRSMDYNRQRRQDYARDLDLQITEQRNNYGSRMEQPPSPSLLKNNPISPPKAQSGRQVRQQTQEYARQLEEQIQAKKEREQYERHLDRSNNNYTQPPPLQQQYHQQQQQHQYQQMSQREVQRQKQEQYSRDLQEHMQLRDQRRLQEQQSINKQPVMITPRQGAVARRIRTDLHGAVGEGESIQKRTQKQEMQQYLQQQIEEKKRKAVEEKRKRDQEEQLELERIQREQAALQAAYEAEKREKQKAAVALEQRDLENKRQAQERAAELLVEKKMKRQTPRGRDRIIPSQEIPSVVPAQSMIDNKNNNQDELIREYREMKNELKHDVQNAMQTYLSQMKEESKRALEVHQDDVRRVRSDMSREMSRREEQYQGEISQLQQKLDGLLYNERLSQANDLLAIPPAPVTQPETELNDCSLKCESQLIFYDETPMEMAPVPQTQLENETPLEQFEVSPMKLSKSISVTEIFNPSTTPQRSKIVEEGPEIEVVDENQESFDIDDIYRRNQSKLELLNKFDHELVRGKSQLNEFLLDLKGVGREKELQVNLGGDSRWIDPNTVKSTRPT